MTPEVIVVLLSGLKDPQFTRRRSTSGNVPRDAQAKRMLEESGFYDYVLSPNRPRADTRGLISKEDNDTVDANQSALLISKIALWLSMAISQRDGLEEVAEECVTNTIEHVAGWESKRQQWWFAVYNNPEARRGRLHLRIIAFGLSRAQATIHHIGLEE